MIPKGLLWECLCASGNFVIFCIIMGNYGELWGNYRDEMGWDD